MPKRWRGKIRVAKMSCDAFNIGSTNNPLDNAMKYSFCTQRGPRGPTEGSECLGGTMKRLAQRRPLLTDRAATIDAIEKAQIKAGVEFTNGDVNSTNVTSRLGTPA